MKNRTNDFVMFRTLSTYPTNQTQNKLKYKKKKLLTNDKLDMKQYDDGPLSNGKTEYS
jgi:hypothetical protein